MNVRVNAAPPSRVDPKSVPSPTLGVVSPSAIRCIKPCTTICATGDIVTVPVIPKLNGFALPSLVEKLISPENVPMLGVANCTVKVSLPPAAIVALSGSAIV